MGGFYKDTAKKNLRREGRGKKGAQGGIRRIKKERSKEKRQGRDITN